MGILGIIIALCMVGTVVVMLRGVYYMLKGGEANSHKSNRMMMMRVGFQGVALFLLFLMFAASR